MSVYGKDLITNNTPSITEENTVIGNYIENNFLESVLNDKANELRKQISSLSEETEFEDFSSLIESILDSDIPAPSKIILMREAVNSVFLESSINSDESGIVSESTLLEYSGNEAKNQEFIAILNELDELITLFMTNIDELLKNVVKLSGYAEKIIKNPGKYKEYVDQMRTDVDTYNEWSKKLFRKANGQITWRKFSSKCRKFNNKYSTIVMEEKKKMAKKLKTFLDKLEDDIDPWCKGGSEIKKVNDKLPELEKLDQSYYNTFFNIFSSFYNVLFDEVNTTYKEIQIVISDLDLNKEYSFSYRFIQAIFKK